MNNKLNTIYQEERNKLTCLSDPEADFEALDNAIVRYNKENEDQITFLDVYYGNI